MLKDQSDDIVRLIDVIWRQFQTYSYDWKLTPVAKIFKEMKPIEQKKIVLYVILDVVGFDNFPYVNNTKFKKVLYDFFLENKFFLEYEKINKITDISKRDKDFDVLLKKVYVELHSYIKRIDDKARSGEIEGIENLL